MNITPIGPRNGGDGHFWCCGLNCGIPCPYGLKFDPQGPESAVPHKFTGTEWCKTCGWMENCVCGFYPLDAVNAYRARFDLVPLS